MADKQPMSSPEEQLQQKLTKLKEAFISQLPEKIESLQTHWRTISEEEWSSDAAKAFHLIVHSLIGTSGTFGFTDISDKARQLETLLIKISANQATPSREDIEIVENAFLLLCSEISGDPNTDQANDLLDSVISSSRSEGTKVLIVDDDVVLANITAQHLRLHGFFVETLAHPATLVEVVKNFSPSIILMDMIFPEGNLAGAAAIEVLRDHNNLTPVIFISSSHDLSARLYAIRTGAYSYLTKPLEFDLLISNIKMACDIKPDLPYRVLIVDDDKQILNLHTAALTNDGMEVYSLLNPLKTLEVIEDFNPEIILLDMHMPECSGLEVAMIIRQSSCFGDIPIVFLSSEEDVSIRMMAIKCGSDDFISKPVNIDYLVRAVQARIEKARKLIESRNIDRNTINKMATSKKLAERANKTKSEFISQMSHELRTPLNTILGYTQLLEIDHDKTLNQSQQGHIQHILASGWHLLALINDVLDISKIEIGHLSLANTETNLDEAIQNAIDMVAKDANSKSIDVSYQNNHSSNITVYADTTRLQQVIVNILSNAIKFNTDNGSVNVTVESLDENDCKITVSDSGRGLPEDKLEHLFKPFSRLGLENTKIEGNGIGLALSSQLVKLMQGEMGAYNNKLAGASFWFTLNKYVQPESFQSDDGLIINVLYIEESDMDFELVSKSLSAQSHIKLSTARNAESALNVAHKILPDVILLDINLSSMDGPTMLNALRTNQQLKQVPIIALSSKEVSLDQQQQGDGLFHCYFSKPYDITKIIKTIDGLLEMQPSNTTTISH